MFWGLKQANNNAERVSSALVALHRAVGFQAQVTDPSLSGFLWPLIIFILSILPQVYLDDFGGAEMTQEKATSSFEAMGELLQELGFEESMEKAEGEREE